VKATVNVVSVLLGFVLGCATTSGGAPPTVPSPSNQPTSVPEAVPLPPKTAQGKPEESTALSEVGTRAPATSPTPELTSSGTGTVHADVGGVGDRTEDGIDDENWLPRADSPAARDFQSAVEIARKDQAAAVDAFVAAGERAKGFYAAWFNAGSAAEQVGRLADAETYYRKSLEIRGDYGLALANLSALLIRRGRGPEGSQLIDEARRRYPERAGPYLAAALLALSRSDLREAEAMAREAMRFDERNVPAMLVMGRIFRAQGRLDTALFAVDNALALEPGNALLHLERGQVLLAQGEKREAILAFERAARLRPTLSEAQEAYGLLLLEQSFPDEAEKVFEQLVRLEPQKAAAHLHLGTALRANKKYPEAEASYRKALQIDPTIVEAYFDLGILYIDDPLPGIDELVRLQKAVEELKLYRERSPDDPAVKKRVDEYIDASEKRIQKEKKRREREEKRKAEEARKAAEEASAKTAPELVDGTTKTEEASPTPPSSTSAVGLEIPAAVPAPAAEASVAPGANTEVPAAKTTTEPQASAPESASPSTSPAAPTSPQKENPDNPPAAPAPQGSQGDPAPQQPSSAPEHAPADPKPAEATAPQGVGEAANPSAAKDAPAGDEREK
jgi:tetratricopeptide (TPR) repeat protein